MGTITEKRVSVKASMDHKVPELNKMLKELGYTGVSWLRKQEKVDLINKGVWPKRQKPVAKNPLKDLDAEQKADYYRSRDKDSAMFIKQECRDLGVKGWSHLRKDELIAVRKAGFTQEAIKAFPKKAPNYGTVADMRKWISANRGQGIDITAESKRWSGGETVSKFKAAQLREFVAHLETLGLKY